jgi:hypothetical protein
MDLDKSFSITFEVIASDSETVDIGGATTQYPRRML